MKLNTAMFIKSFVGACIAAMALSLNIEPVDQSPAALEEILTQTSATTISKEICQRTATRNKAALPDFYGILGGATKYTDTDFKHDWSAMAWKDASETYAEMVPGYKSTVWKRASEAFPGKTLWGSKGITPEDIVQGEVGNCWFISAVSALAEKKSRMESVFLNDAASANGIYGVNFYSLGVPHTVIVDDFLPLRKSGTKYTTTAGGVGVDGSLWGAVLEKAFAKYHGNYFHTNGGSPSTALKTLHGAPVTYHTHAEKTLTVDKLWKAIKAADAAGHMMTAGTPSIPGKNHFDKLANGLSISHAFTVLSAHELKDAKGKTIKLLKIRNPWGKEEYKGPYSDSSKLWTDDLRKQAGATKNNEGVFFMPIADFKKSFTET